MTIDRILKQVPTEHMRDAVERYLTKGIPGGSFLTAVLCNDLTRSVGQADIENMANICQWASWLYNACPSEAWGSPEKVAAWSKKGGMNQ